MEKERTLRLGAASEVITPRLGSSLFGYWPGVYATEVNDDLTATALVFDDGECRALMLSITVAVVDGALCERILSLVEKEHGIKKENCLVHATHTHSGPCTSLKGLDGWGSADMEYIDGVFIPQIIRAVGKAKAKMTEVKMGVATGESYIGCNRRELTVKNTVRLGQNPWAPFDPIMTVICFKDAEEKIVASIIHYGAHCTASGVNTEITRDWAGVMIDALAEHTGGVTAFFNGPEGDVGPRLKSGGTTGNCTVQAALEHGRWAAEDAIKIFDKITEWKDADIRVAEGDIVLPLNPLPDYEYARAIYEKTKDAVRNLRKRQSIYYKAIMDKHEAGYVNKESVTERQTLLRIGDVVFASFPYELFAEIGLRIARRSKIPHTLSLALTNGQVGYFVTQDQICRGGYEVEMFKTMYEQPLVDNADWYLVAHTLKNLKKLGG